MSFFPLSAYSKKTKGAERGILEKMVAVPCGAKQTGLAGLGALWGSAGITHINSNEKQCPQYLLRTDEMDYENGFSLPREVFRRIRKKTTRIGRIMDKISSLGLDKNTYVFWTTDNGAWQDVYPDAGYPRVGCGESWVRVADLGLSSCSGCVVGIQVCDHPTSDRLLQSCLHIYLSTSTVLQSVGAR